MKLSKVLMTVAAAAALVGFAGCKTADEDAHGILSIKGDTASVNYTNETTDTTHRGFKTLKTKHTDAVAVITIDTEKCKENGDRAGVFGFIFDLDKTKKVKNSNGEEKTVYDFSAVSVRKNGNLCQAYISRFEGVCADYLDGGNNFKDADGKELSKTPTDLGAKETTILYGKNNAAYATLATPSILEDGTAKVAIEVVANVDGTYAVNFFDGKDATVEPKEKDVDENGNKIKTGQIKTGATPLSVYGSVDSSDGKCTVDASWKDTANGKTKQTDMGFYAAVYPSCTLVGSIQLPYILNEDEVCEWDD